MMRTSGVVMRHALGGTSCTCGPVLVRACHDGSHVHPPAEGVAIGTGVKYVPAVRKLIGVWGSA